MSGDPLAPARRAACVAGVTADLAAAACGLLPSWALLAAGAMVFAGGWRERKPGGKTAPSVLALLLGVVALVPIATDPTPEHEIRTMAVLLVGLGIVSALHAPGPRELRAWLALSATLLLAAGTVTTGVVPGVVLVLAWAMVLAGVVLLQHGRPVAGRVVRHGRAAPVLPAVAVAVLAGIACTLLVPAGRGDGLRHKLTGAANTGGAAGTVDLDGNGNLDLDARGALSSRALVTVPADSPRLWRGTVYADFGGRTWTAGHVDPDPPVTGTARTDTVHLAPGRTSQVVWSPGTITAVDGTPTSSGGEGLVFDGPARGYTVASTVTSTDPVLLAHATGPDDVDPRYLQLPASADGVAALADSITAGATSRYDTVGRIETWLRTHARYSLDAPVPGPGDDAVVAFLFRDRVGFCEQFAAAETVLLRSRGIPARLVTGLAYGVPGPGGTRTYRDSDAHAWVEVFYPGIGWSPSDPTAGAQLAHPRAGLDARARAAYHRLLAALPGGKVALAALIALVALLAISVRLPRRTRRRRGPTRPGPVLAAYLPLEAGRGDGETPGEHLRRTTGIGADTVATLEQELYGPAPPTPAAVAAAVGELQRVP
jgi:transglutaminase-like putative cysteine protease